MVSRSVREASWTVQEERDIALLHGLVGIPSVSGTEAEAVAYLREEMAARGMTILDDEAGNAIGTIGDGDRHIVLLGHIDTVPGEIPVRVEDDVLWGRGAVDAKGPLATFVAASTALADTGDARITIVGAVGEETIGSLGAHAVSEWPAPEFCIIGEPSGWDAVCLGYRGTLSLFYMLRRSARHTAGPGESVAEEAVAFWNALQAEIDIRNAGTANTFTAIGPSLRKIMTTSDGLNDVVEMSIGLRLPPAINAAELITTVRELAGDAEITVDGVQQGYRTTKRSKLIPPFLRGIRAEGGEPGFTLKLGTSDMNVVGPVWGCPIVAYGPGDSSLDHTPDERLELDEYLKAVRVLTGVLTSLAGRTT